MGLLMIRVPNIEGYDFGVGVERLSGSPMNQAVAATQTPPASEGGRMSFEVSRIESSRDLQKKLQIDIEASAGCASFGAGASARFQFMSESKVHSACLFMTVTSVVRLAALSIDQSELVPQAKEAAARPDVFSARYGDMFCRACTRGGIFIGVLRIEVQDARTATEVEGALQGAYGAFSAEAQTKFKTVLETHHARSHYSLYTEGGPPLNITDPFNPLELLENANKWQLGMQADGEKYSVPYEWTLSPLTIAEGPMPLNAAQLQHAQDVLQFCARERTDLLDKLHAYNWVDDHADSYEWTAEITPEGVRQAMAAAQADLDLVAKCAGTAIDNPAAATMPAEFAKTRSTTYPTTVALPLPQRKASAPQAPQVELPNLVGKSLPTVSALLAQRGLHSQYSAPQEKTENGQTLVGEVVGMSPAPGSMVPQGSVVMLEIGNYRVRTPLKRIGKAPVG